MSSLKERMLAKKLAKQGAVKPPVSTEESVKKSLHPQKAPEQPVTQPKAESQAVNQDANYKPTATQTTPNKAVLGGAAALLQAAKKAQANAATTTVTASSVAERAKALATQKPEPKPEPTAPVPSVKRVAPKPVRSAAATIDTVDTLSKVVLDNEQTEEVQKLEGLDADTFMADMLMLEDYIKGDVEDIATLQQRTHYNLKQYPELTHILNDAQIGVIVQALLKRRNIEVVTPSKGQGSTNVKKMVGAMTKDQILDSL